MIPYRKGIETVSIYQRPETRPETRDGDQTRDRDQTETKRASSAKTLEFESQPIAKIERGLALEEKPTVSVYADGACEPNPGPGAWAFVVYWNGVELHSETGADLDTTNNRMELTAVFMALGWIAEHSPSKALLHSDSQYVVRGCNEWRRRWKAKGWKKGSADMPNADLWRELDGRLEARPINLVWVRGHSGR
ncbi:ribonuclease H [Rhizobium sp. YIM 134829]|uniref:ribonuclease H family protein n=1 Tax=Rhizobium sp. YIM 134829 TaxID=3390453 RepID=UPI0039787189